jgi:hypothetical protein
MIERDTSDKVTNMHSILPAMDDKLDNVQNLLRISVSEYQLFRDVGFVEGLTNSLFFKIDQQYETSGRSTTPQSVRINHYTVPRGRAVRDFVGREGILEIIEKGFSSGRGPRIVVLRGMEGQVKTQIALEYCRRVKGKRGVFWVDATSETTVKRSFETIATKIQATEDIMDVLGDSLDPRLMVFDNYDDADAFYNIRDYMPDGEDGCILITSRHAASINLVVDADYAIELGGLLEHEALELLWKHSRVKEAAPAPNGSTVIVESLVIIR